MQRRHRLPDGRATQRRRPRMLVAAAAAAPLALAAFAHAQAPAIGVAPVVLDRPAYELDTAEQHGIRVDVVVRGLAHPFGFAMLPNGDALIVERGGAVRLVRRATGDAELVPTPVPGAPPAADFRGGGLHDIALHPQFEQTRLVYFTYNRPGAADPAADPAARRPTAITVLRARFDGTRLDGVEEIFAGEERPGGSGSRLAFAGPDTLYVTTGAPFDDAAQRLDNVYGKVLRLTADGKPHPGNPFAGRAGARAEIFTLGHRDQLGLAVHPLTGVVLSAEHGPNGGDEVNLLVPGRNYGWPEYSFGRTYEGARHSERPLGPDTEQPLILWVPSIAPTG